MARAQLFTHDAAKDIDTVAKTTAEVGFCGASPGVATAAFTSAGATIAINGHRIVLVLGLFDTKAEARRGLAPPISRNGFFRIAVEVGLWQDDRIRSDVAWR